MTSCTRLGEEIGTGESREEFSALTRSRTTLRSRLDGRGVTDDLTVAPLKDNFTEIIGRSEALRRILRLVEVVALTNATVLILGETGTGKELVARAAHRMSPRRARPLITLNCAAIPTGLLESELFGYERGAFTGVLRPP